MGHNPFETTAKEHVKKIAENYREIFIDENDDEEERKKAKEEAKEIRRFLEESTEDPTDKKAREEALYKAILEVAKKEPYITIKGICELVFGDESRKIFVLNLEEMLDKEGTLDPLLVRFYLSDLAEERSDVIIKNIGLLNFSYTGQILEQAVFSAAERYPEAALAYVDRYAHLSYAKWVIERAAWVAAEKYPYVAFKYVDSYEDQPYARAVIEKAVKTALRQKPDALLLYIDAYKDLPDAEQITEKASFAVAELDSESAFRYIDSYKDKPYAGKVIEIAIRTATERNPYVVLKYVDYYKNLSYAKWVLERAAWVAAEQEPKWAFVYFNSYKDQPYAGKVIEKAARTAAEEDPETAFIWVESYEDQPYAGEVIEKAARTAAEKYPRDAFEYIKHYKDQPYAREVLIIAVQKDMEGAFRYAFSYRDQPYAKEIFLIAIDLNPWDFLDSSDRVADCFAPAELEILRDRCKRYVLLVEKSGKKKLPSQMIQLSDFPFDKELLRFSILKANRKIDGDFNAESNLISSDIPFRDFERIFFSEPAQDYFKLHTGEFTYMNAISVSKTVYRKLYKEGKTIDDEAIREALVFVAEEREKVASRELFGPHTKLIIFSHEEERFDANDIIKKIWKRSGGKDEDVVANEKGVCMEGKVNSRKERTLQSIRDIKSPTTILFTGHGSPENWAFARNTAKDLDHSLTSSPIAINYKEMGDALIASGHIADVNLIGCTCFAYDYLMNLFHYMESKGVKEKPYVSISTANKNQLSWGSGRILNSKLLEAFHKVSKDDGPITVNDFFKAESLLWRFEDPALFVGKIGGTERYRFPWKSAIWPTRKSRSEPSDIFREAQSLPQSPLPSPEACPKHFLEVGGDYKLSGIERLV